ncbi:BufA1 family periplasmic bufferin-type metallophore [Vibrio vulnificus]
MSVTGKNQCNAAKHECAGNSAHDSQRLT